MQSYLSRGVIAVESRLYLFASHLEVLGVGTSGEALDSYYDKCRQSGGAIRVLSRRLGGRLGLVSR